MERLVQTENFYEQGSEGSLWSLYDNSKSGYEGLIILQEGDWVNIIGSFKGYIKKQQQLTASWTQEGWDKLEWAMLFVEERPALYRAKQKKPVIYTTDFNFIN